MSANRDNPLGVFVMCMGYHSSQTLTDRHTLPESIIASEKWWLEELIPCWDGIFWGAMLVARSICFYGCVKLCEGLILDSSRLDKLVILTPIVTKLDTSGG